MPLDFNIPFQTFEEFCNTPLDAPARQRLSHAFEQIAEDRATARPRVPNPVTEVLAAVQAAHAEFVGEVMTQHTRARIANRLSEVLAGYAFLNPRVTERTLGEFTVDFTLTEEQTRQFVESGGTESQSTLRERLLALAEEFQSAPPDSAARRALYDRFQNELLNHPLSYDDIGRIAERFTAPQPSLATAGVHASLPGEDE